MTLISMAGASVAFGEVVLLRDVTFTIARGERWGVIGRNGTGKTTLFRILTGERQPTAGSVARAPGVTVSLLEQHRDFGGAHTVWEAAAGEFVHLLELERSLAEQGERMAELGDSCTQAMLDRYARDLERFEREGGYTMAPRVDAVLHGLGFDPVAARTRPLDALSGGERGRVGLARQLASPADVLLLDEPTNHLDLDTTRWLESYISSTDRTVVVVSHDRAFLAAIADHILHVEGGTAVPYSGGYESFVQQRTERRVAQQRAYERQVRVVAEEEEYIRRNIAGQNSRQAKGRRTRLARLPRLSPPVTDQGAMAVRFEARERGGDQVAVAEGVTIAVGDRILVRDLTGVVRRGDRLALVAPNGAGKSTLLRTLMGEREPASGSLRLGVSATVAYYRQDLGQVPMDRTLYDIIADLRPSWGRGEVYGHLGRFGFSGEETKRIAATLSGGERARVALAMMMLSGANLLIFDEPTNHLDVESIEALEDAIERYGGTVILVSHDRALLRALCTRVWVLHDGRVTDFDGSFAEWESVSAEREHAARVVAEEEEGRRRVEERARIRRRDAVVERSRRESRGARGRTEEAEARVVALEERVADLTRELEDPGLYTSPDGVARATSLGRELDVARNELDAAMAAWMALAE